MNNSIYVHPYSVFMFMNQFLLHHWLRILVIETLFKQNRLRKFIEFNFSSIQEFLVRDQGMYKLPINFHPHYPVKNARIDVAIQETRDILNLTLSRIPGGKDLIHKGLCQFAPPFLLVFKLFTLLYLIIKGKSKTRKYKNI